MTPGGIGGTGSIPDRGVPGGEHELTVTRPDVAASPRTVVKIGSSSLTTPDGAIDDARIAALTAALAA
ncbi:MAG: hypothetical protein WAN00_28765, partial [Trebonia sp.]